MRTKSSALIPDQVPEYVRADYPTFVAFVEAYYEYLDNQGIDLTEMRDIDTTLDSFIKYFKKELAVNVPTDIKINERFLLKHIKEQYLAKGSEGSFKLLFRLLYDKPVEVAYPGRAMLRASDGRWQQDISMFVKVSLGNPADIDGKLVDVIKPNSSFKILIDRRQYVEVEVDRVVQLSDDTYELFIDRKYFGDIAVGDVIRYKELFTGTIVATTSALKITAAGTGFKAGQLFELKNGSGVRSIIKVNRTDADGGVLNAEFIKFGIGYATDFEITIDSTKDFYTTDTVTKALAVSIGPGGGVAANIITGGLGYTSSPTITISAPATGTQAVGSATIVNGTITNIAITGASGYSSNPTITIGYPGTVTSPVSWAATTSVALNAYLLTSDSNYYKVTTAGTTGSTRPTFTSGSASNGTAVLQFIGKQATAIAYQLSASATVADSTAGFGEQGYISKYDYTTPTTSADRYMDGSYVGTLLREFSVQPGGVTTYINPKVPASIRVTLGSLAKYPGYFSSNDGFLSDAMFIQDSRYYQPFSYVLRIDERLASYRTAVRTMVHPAGTALFGEFQIQNNFDISITLESLVKALSLSLKDTVTMLDTSIVFFSSKQIDDTQTIVDGTQSSGTMFFVVSKALADSISTPTDSATKLVGKALADSISTPTDALTQLVGKALDDSISTPTDDLTQLVGKALDDSSAPTDVTYINTDKYIQDTTVGTFTENGYVSKNPYSEGGYFATTPIYYNDEIVQTFSA